LPGGRPCTTWEQEWSTLTTLLQAGATGLLARIKNLEAPSWASGIPLNNPTPLMPFAAWGRSCCHLAMAIQGAFSALRRDLHRSNPTWAAPPKDVPSPSRELLSALDPG